MDLITIANILLIIGFILLSIAMFSMMSCGIQSEIIIKMCFVIGIIFIICGIWIGGYSSLQSLGVI